MASKKIFLTIFFLLLSSYAFSADRYWNPAGAANWGDANVWATTDGGDPTGIATPTSADDVYFTSTNVNDCAVAVTANCKSLSFSGGTGYSGTFSGSSLINVYGSLTLDSAMNKTYTGTVTFKGNTSGRTITCDTETLNSVYVNDGASLTMQDAMNLGTSGDLNFTQGTLITNSQTLTCRSISSNNSNTRTLNFDGSTINLSGGTPVDFTNKTNLTISGTYTIVCTGSNHIFNGNGITYSSLTSTVNNSNATINGENTFANLTFNGGAVLADGCSLGANQTVTGTLTINGNSTQNRFILSSSTLGTPVTVTCNGTVTGQYFDLLDIAAAGSASWDISGVTGGSGDMGGNQTGSAITFTTADTETWNNVDGGNWSGANWTGAVTSRVPLPQDTVAFGAINPSKTITVDCRNLGGSVSFSGATNTPTLTLSNAVNVYGNLNLTGIGSFTGAQNVAFYTRSLSSTLTSGGKTFPGSVSLKAVGGKLTAQDATIITTQFQNWAGTFDANDFSVTARDYTDVGTSSAITRNVTMGNGTWTLNRTSSTAWTISGSNSTATGEGSTIVISDTGSSTKTFAGGDQTYNHISITAGGTGSINFTGNNGFNNFTINAPKTVKFTAASTTTFTGNFTATGDASNAITIGSITSATHNLSKASGTVSVAYCTISYSAAAGGASWQAYTTNGNTNGGNNSGWLFSEQDNAAMFQMF